MYRISVIVCTANPTESLKKSLYSLLRCDPTFFELIVIDQSPEGVESLFLEDPELKDRVNWIKHGDRGLSKARNLGISESNGDIIAFTDDDAYVDTNWIGAIQETFSHPSYQVGIAGGKVIPVYEEKNPDWYLPKNWEFILPAYDQGDALEPYRFGLPPGVNYAISRELFEEIGGFDESVGVITGRKVQIYGEDSDFTLRALEKGYHVLYNPRSIVFHPVPLSRQTKAFVRNRLKITGITREYLKLKRNPSPLVTRVLAALKEELSVKKRKDLKYHWWVLKGRLVFHYRELMGDPIK